MEAYTVADQIWNQENPLLFSFYAEGGINNKRINIVAYKEDMICGSVIGGRCGGYYLMF